MQEHLFKQIYNSKHSDVLSDASITFTDKVFIYFEALRPK